jgi:hypothetical protein
MDQVKARDRRRPTPARERTTIVRVIMRPQSETSRRREVGSWLQRLLAAVDPDQQPGRDRLGHCY